MRTQTKVRDIEEMFANVSAVAPDRLENAAVVVEGQIQFIRIREPNNIILEFFSVDPVPTDRK